MFPHLFQDNNQLYINDLLFHEWGHIIQFYNPTLLQTFIAQIGPELPPTQYGKTSPKEDLSESISVFITHQPDNISKLRTTWVSSYLGCQ